jgi:hypothetical protein
MSAEPARRPEDEEAPRPEDKEAPRPEDAPRPEGDVDGEMSGPPANTDAPSADESLTDDLAEPLSAPDEALTPEAAADAEAAGAASQDPVASEAAVMTADAQGAETTAEAVATIDAATDEAAAQAKAAEDAAAADKKERSASRRRAVGGALKTVATVVIGAVLLVAGIAIGNYAYLTTRPTPIALGDPGTNLENPAPAAQEFIAALAVNDADAIRSSLDAGPHIDLSREMEKYGIQSVDSVDVLGTTVDGPRSATEILMHYQREDGIAFAINLVILVNDGKIEGFR